MASRVGRCRLVKEVNARFPLTFFHSTEPRDRVVSVTPLDSLKRLYII